MDNFALWVDAPSEALIVTPMDDETNVFIRDEILQIQQLVGEKLDDQKTEETEREEKEGKERALAKKLKEAMAVESNRSEAARVQLVKLQESCRSKDMQLISMKKSFPVCEQPADNHDQAINEMNLEISKLVCNLAIRNENLKKLQTDADHDKDADSRKAELKKLKTSIMEAKEKYDTLLSLHTSVRTKTAEVELAEDSFKKDQAAVNAENKSLEEEKKALDKMKEECIELRSALVHVETNVSMEDDGEVKKIESAQEQAEKSRLDADDVMKALNDVKEQVMTEQKKLAELDEQNTKDLETYETEKNSLMDLIREKFVEAKQIAQRDRVFREIHSLKLAIREEEEDLELAKDELKGLTPSNVETISELRKEVHTIEKSTRTHEKLIRDAVSKNDKLIEQIAALNPPTPEDLLDETLDLESEQAPPETFEKPALEVKETPPRKHSTDAFTGAPLMTSTPVQNQNKRKLQDTQTGTQANRQTRAAARRLAENATLKTAAVGNKKAKR